MSNSTPPVAALSVSITQFTPITTNSGGLSTATFAWAGTPPACISLSQVDQSLTVTGPVTLQFTLLPASQYIIVGVSFSQNDGGMPGVDRNGLQNFPVTETAVVNGVRVLTVTDNDTPQYGGADLSYEYDLVIQRISDGALGLIDPMITNQNR